MKKRCLAAQRNDVASNALIKSCGMTRFISILLNQITHQISLNKCEPMAEQHRISIKVNGREYERFLSPRLLLSDFLRHELGLTGTHVGCEHGVCGACTVLLNGESVRSCLLFAVQADGQELLTVEGLAGESGTLHPLQAAFREAHALQCGFCTPGFLMSLIPFLAENPTASDAEIREGLSGNLCRCTGYQNIVEAVRNMVSSTATETQRPQRKNGE